MLISITHIWAEWKY